MFHLYGRRAQVFRLKYGLRFRQRFGRFPSAFAYRRLCIGNSRIVYDIFFFDAHIDAGFCFHRQVGVIGAGDRLVLPVHFVQVDFFQRVVKYKALAPVPVLFADFPDTVPADSHMERKSQNRKTDDIHILFQQIIGRG